jgi:hypothetical protein
MLLAAVFTSVVRLPASVCAFSSAPIGKACHLGCCADKSCCVDSQKKHDLPSPPLAKDGSSNHQLIAIVATSLTISVFEFHSIEVSPESSANQVGRPTPRPAFLCTFLI